MVDVRAEIAIFNAFSGHADHNGLMQFSRDCGDPRNVFLVHGEPERQAILTEAMNTLPNFGNTKVSTPAP